ncbi:MAG: polymer-forming cytoskeletal protein [Treponema sp.]|nr:polymer-forming cytoskeletal protein [Treponema sp.]
MSEEKKIELNEDDERKTLTVFGPETEFDGVLEFSDDLIITGKFNGRIKATGNLEISKDSICTVEKMSARSIVISGSVSGNVEASERVEICNGGSVIGDIVTARLRIENNVNFEGQITMLDRIPEENLFASASAEYKQAMVLRTDIIE